MHQTLQVPLRGAKVDFKKLHHMRSEQSKIRYEINIEEVTIIILLLACIEENANHP